MSDSDAKTPFTLIHDMVREAFAGYPADRYEEGPRLLVQRLKEVLEAKKK